MTSFSEEDNDDLVPILEQHSDRLRSLYGEFYISELISRHPESERILIVCEHSELAVGVMCLNTQINYESLEESFVLSPFGGLRHLDDAPKFMPKEVESTYSLLNEAYAETTKAKDSKDAKSRVTWVFEDDEFNTFRSVGVAPPTPTERLARLFLHKFDPFMMGDPENCEAPPDLLPRYSSAGLGFKGSSTTGSRLSITSQFRRWQPVMKFESPIVQFASLPGPLYYLKLRKPGREVPMAIQQCLPRQGHTLLTDKGGNYFRLHLNVLHVVDAVTCLSHKPFSPEILQQLYGKHEAFFNKLYTRFQKKQIDDFYDFFTQPWMSALYQESFRDLVDDINEQDIGTIQDLVKSKFAMFDPEVNQMKSTMLESERSTESLASSSDYLQEPRKVGTFRSMIDKFVARAMFDKAAEAGTPMPSECGQSKQVRMEASTFWKKVSGERIVMAHVSRYLDKHSVTNPHFAIPKPESV
ncbi:cilia- and flagella-associated protein 61-like [Helicoverpa zea]|uniref:cilia- and flagella-associated protein 61-like n=1 Tax=Helicoverpa zea TaxID=7113 RepID=UPI001F590ADA|nr:cilia- and flagella-associated protein 61-like [Helicoverpa zea]